MVVKDGVDFESLDGTPAKIIFLIAAPNTEDNVHLQVLSKLSVMLMDEQFTNSLINAGSVDEFLNIIDSAEKAKDEKEAAKEAKEPVEVKKDDVFIVAVTACPTGIAHTYMVAEAIEKKAKELGYQVKVETRGSAGAKNVLTDDEIAKATGVIVACDTNVPTDRFDGKKVIECQVSDGINKTEELVKRIVTVMLLYLRHQVKRGFTFIYWWKGEHWTSDLQASDERCFTYASVRSWWWYPYRNRVPYRWIQC